MKIIFEIENGQDKSLTLAFSLEQRALVRAFVSAPNSFSTNSKKLDENRHQDGTTERWLIELSQNFALILDCNIPSPWSTTDDECYYAQVVIVGHEVDGRRFEF